MMSCCGKISPNSAPGNFNPILKMLLGEIPVETRSAKNCLQCTLHHSREVQQVKLSIMALLCDRISALYPHVMLPHLVNVT